MWLIWSANNIMQTPVFQVMDLEKFLSHIWVNTAVIRFCKSTYYIIFLNMVEYITIHKLPVCTIMCLRRFTVSVNPRPQ